MNKVMIGGIKSPANKSKAASRVLKLMDEDFSYQQALKIALKENKGVGKRTLEKELDRYI